MENNIESYNQKPDDLTKQLDDLKKQRDTLIDDINKMLSWKQDFEKGTTDPLSRDISFKTKDINKLNQKIAHIESMLNEMQPQRDKPNKNPENQNQE